MPSPFARRRQPTSTLLLATLLSACGIVAGDSGSDFARVEISGTTTVPLELVTSDNFTVVVEPETLTNSVDLIRADTVTLPSLPFGESYSIAEFKRFFVRLSNADSTAASVRMRVFIDGREMYDASGDLEDGIVLEFLFRLNEFR